MIQWLIQMWDVGLVESGGNIFLNPSVEKVDQLANNPFAKGELFNWNDTNSKPFASILYKFLLVMLCAAVRISAVLLMKWLRSR